jgi:hypothetical protein
MRRLHGSTWFSLSQKFLSCLDTAPIQLQFQTKLYLHTHSPKSKYGGWTVQRSFLRNLVMNNDDQTNLTRRKYLTGGAAVAASAALTACGGGGDDLDPPLATADTVQEAIEAEVAANRVRPQAGGTPIIDLSTTTREVYFIEVSFKGTRAAYVDLYPSNSSGAIRIGQRAANTGTAHALQFATLDTTPSNQADSSTTRTNLLNQMWMYVRMDQSTGHSNAYMGTPISHGTNAKRTKYTDFSETEWLVAWQGTPTATNWDVSVRFFKAATADRGTRRSTWITEMYQYEPNHDNNAGKTLSYPKFYGGLPTEATTHAAGIIVSTSNGADTLAIPNHRHAGHFELIKPLGHVHSASASAQHGHRRLQRHMERFGDKIKSESAATTANIQLKSNRVHNELMKVIFGGTIGDKVTSAAADSVAKIQNATSFTVDSGLETLCQYADDLDTTANQTDIQRALDETPRQPELGSAGGGASASMSLQAKVDATFLMPFIEYPTHAAVRASLLIARKSWASLTADGINSSKTTTYRLSQRATSGIKLTVTGVLGPSWPESVCTVDVEVNVAMTIKNDSTGNRKTRVDAIVLDPVLDINLRNWTTKLLEKAMAKVLNRVANIVSNGNVETIASGLRDASSASAWSAMAQNFNPGLVSGGMLSAGAAKLEQMALSALQNNGRTWSLIEFSVLRLGFFNSDAYDTYTGAFRPGFQGSLSFAYFPGVKYLAYTGFEAKLATLSGVVRIGGGGDAYMLYGTKGVQGAVLNSAVTGGAT